MSNDLEQALELNALFDQIGWYLQTAAPTLLAYEYVITVDREVKLFWNRQITVASVLFCFNRYLPLAVAILYLPFDQPGPDSTYASCAAIQYIPYVLTYLQYVPWALFSALRAYVLSNSRVIGYTVFLLSIVPVVSGYVAMAHYIISIDDEGCGWNQSLSFAIQTILVLASRSALIASDILILIVTWAKTYRDRKDILETGLRSSLSGILYRDGVIYFLISLSLHILHLIALLQTSSENYVNAINLSFVSEVTTAILISRFLMDLQDVNYNTMHQQSLSSFGSPHLNSFIGALGSSLPAPGLPEADHEASEVKNSNGIPKHPDARDGDVLEIGR